MNNSPLSPGAPGSRNFPLNDSLKPFCHGEPGSMYNVFTPDSAHIIFFSQDGSNWYLHDGQGPYKKAHIPVTTPHYSRDGKRFTYLARTDEYNKRFVVDTLTGEYRLLRVDIVHDCGDSLNPAMDLGQVEGGYVQGVGWLTSEELCWNEAGELTTHAPSTYKIPTC